MSKLDIPALKGSLSPSNINAWLNACADSFEAYGLMNPDRKLAPGLQILCAGLKMEEDDAKLWWNENRDTLKVLTTWADFATRVRERFVPANWRLDALARFFSTRQGKNDFRVFLTDLQAARNALSSAGKGYAVNDAMFKNHLLFHSNPVLQLRVRALPSLVYADLKLDALINLLQSTWDSLLAEGFASARSPLLARSASALSPTSGASAPVARTSLPPLSDDEGAGESVGRRSCSTGICGGSSRAGAGSRRRCTWSGGAGPDSVAEVLRERGMREACTSGSRTGRLRVAADLRVKRGSESSVNERRDTRDEEKS